MPRLKESPSQKMTRIFQATVGWGLQMRGEDLKDLAKRMPVLSRRESGHGSLSTIYNRMRDATTCTNLEMLEYAKFFNQLPGGDKVFCEMYGVTYHGATPPPEEKAG